MFDFIVIEFCQSNGNNTNNAHTHKKKQFYSSSSIRPMWMAFIPREMYVGQLARLPSSFCCLIEIYFIPLSDCDNHNWAKKKKNWIKIFDSSALIVYFANHRFMKCSFFTRKKKTSEFRKLHVNYKNAYSIDFESAQSDMQKNLTWISIQIQFDSIWIPFW